MTGAARPPRLPSPAEARRFSFGDLHGEVVERYRPEPFEQGLRSALDPGAAVETVHWGRNYLFRARWSTVGGEAVDVVVKQFRNKGLKNGLRRLLGGSKAQRSWRAARGFEAAGLATAEPVALVESADPKGPSFFVSRLLEGAVESRYLFRAMNAGTAAEDFADIEPVRFLHDLGRTLARMHDAGFFHRDLSIGNVLLVWPSPGRRPGVSPDLSIIDLNRCRRRDRIGLLTRTRDLCRLTIERPLDQARFLTAYWGKPPGPLQWSVFWLMHNGFRVKLKSKKAVRRLAHGLKALAPRTTHAHIPEAPDGASARDKVVWDPLSDQPHQHASRVEKWAVRVADAGSHIRNALTVVGAAPRIVRRYRRLIRSLHAEPIAWPGVGVAVQPFPDDPDALLGAIADLGVEQVLLRLEPWRDDHDHEEQLARSLAAAGYELSFSLPQNRALVTDPARWRAKVDELARRFLPFGQTFQIGQAVNRSKWGIWRTEEYIEMAATAADILRSHAETVRILGPAVIDFELHGTAAIVNTPRSPIRFDALASLLYVDRRGAPENRQLGFDTVGKVALCKAIAETARACGPASWITEVNWPLWEGPHSPAGRTVSVDEATQAHFLARFFLLALGTGLAERVFWWQVIAPGYGLIDPRGGALRRRPSFHALATLGRLLSGARFLGPQSSPPGTFAYHFSRPDGRDLVAAWSVEEGREMALEESVETCLAESGETIETPRGGRLSLGPSVQFLLMARGGADK